MMRPLIPYINKSKSYFYVRYVRIRNPIILIYKGRFMKTETKIIKNQGLYSQLNINHS